MTKIQVECVVKRTQGGGFHVHKRQTSLALCWKQQELLVRKSSTKIPMMLVRESQDLLKEFEQVATRGGNESNNCCTSISKRRAET
ncbi:hypothetical protein MTR67_040328 [Solanum verrucosum]|uniref:Uncharacterized protein n=1 Tax=Solanum verrucosum TaxID=315347 RepID=A0AAF0UIE3_SOLVR|nr:hypothetical protein MTR67_040328 [Solanum verrucosum]